MGAHAAPQIGGARSRSPPVTRRLRRWAVRLTPRNIPREYPLLSTSPSRDVGRRGAVSVSAGKGLFPVPQHGIRRNKLQANRSRIVRIRR